MIKSRGQPKMMTSHLSFNEVPTAAYFAATSDRLYGD